jgi:hypothetical protein
MNFSVRARRDDDLSSLRRQVRLLVLLEAAEAAGLVPLNILRLHAFAYLSNVLAPVWDLSALDGKVLKRRGGPFYPALQHDLDRLVGIGLVFISGLGHVRDDEKRWRLEGSYRLNHALTDVVQRHLVSFEEERRLVSFVQELAYAISALSDKDMDRAFSEDATYSDPMVSFGSIVDFDEWRRTNYSANAARQFENLMPSGARATAGEKLHLYVRHLYRRIHGGS